MKSFENPKYWESPTGGLSEKGKLRYAINLLKYNPIRPNEVDYYSGKKLIKGKDYLHGIEPEIWKKASTIAKNKGFFVIDD